MYEIDEVTEFVDGGRKQLKISPRANPVVVYGGTWKLFLDKGMSQLVEAILDKKLAGLDLGVFLWLVDQMGPGNRFELTQREMAERMGMTQPQVCRSMGYLRAEGLVRKGMVSPLVVTKGRTEDYAATLAAWHKLGDVLQPRVFGTQPQGEK